jgi:Response regulator containing a CheY-like receiver domain and a GGDEF domain
MAAEEIVLVDDDRVIQKMVGGFLERSGYRVRRASDGIEALEMVNERVPDLVITDVRMPELNGIELTSRLRGNHRTAGIPILMFGPRRTRRAGRLCGWRRRLPAEAFRARDTRGEGRIDVAAVGRRSDQSQPGQGDPVRPRQRRRRYHLARCQYRGPVGGAVSETGWMLDLDVEFGDSAVYLNVHPNQTLADLKAAPGTVVDEALFAGFITESGSVRLVVGADLPERADLVTLPAIQLAIDRLSLTCGYVLIDAPASFSERTLTALDTSDLICLVTSGSLPSLKATRGCLDLFEKLGVASGRVRLILNYSTTHAIDIDTATSVLGRRPDFVVQHSDSLDRAANSGRPLVVSDPNDPLVADLRKLADAMAITQIRRP